MSRSVCQPAGEFNEKDRPYPVQEGGIKAIFRSFTPVDGMDIQTGLLSSVK
jgi:hypothetical protein